MEVMTIQRAHNSVLHVLGEHDDEARVLLPHHAPEVHHGVVQRSLARDVVVADVAGALETEVTHNYVTQIHKYHFTKICSCAQAPLVPRGDPNHCNRLNSFYASLLSTSLLSG